MSAMAQRAATEGHADVVIGLQHGDEGKGRFVDAMAAGYDLVARYNGGANAGHTYMINGHHYAGHQVPSGVNHPHIKLYIGAGCVVNMEKLCSELDEIEAAGLEVLPRLRIAGQASVIQPGHIVRDLATMQAIGTTGNGIGAAYADKPSRIEMDRLLDVRMGELLVDTDAAFRAIQRNLETELERYNVQGCDVKGTMHRLRICFERIKTCIERDPEILCKEIHRGMVALFEGAQSYWLSNTHGATPYVTGSDATVSAAFNSLNVPVDYKGKAYGVAKLIPSRVGAGPFPTEFGGSRSETYCTMEGGKRYTKDVERELYGHRIHELLQSDDDLDVGIALRIVGNEYGASTGRPRRLGKLDLMKLGSAVRSNGLDGLYLTKADRLTDFAQTHDHVIPVATGYRMNGDIITHVPTTTYELHRVSPIIEDFPAFTEDISETRTIDDLPEELLLLLSALRDRLDCAILSVGVGPRRDQVVHLNGQSSDAGW